MKRYMFIIFLFNQILVAQTSLYSGKNPYVTNYSDGQTIKVNVNSVFIVSSAGDWSDKFEVNLKLQPDKINVPFLNPSEQSKANNRMESDRNNLSEKLKFSLNAILTRQPNGTYKLTANKIIQLDGKTTSVNCSGIIDDKWIKNGSVNSDEIADLNLTIISKPQIPKDNNFDPGKENESKDGKSQTFTPEQVRAYVKQYMQEILGALQ